jgi:hypothetical protein
LLTPGGFRKLIERAAWFPDCQHLASTFPSTTLATIATGAWPAQHGMVADSWFDKAAKRTVTASYEALGATTLAAQIERDLRDSAGERKSNIYVFSDRSSHARLFAAGSAAKIFWMDETGQFATQGDTPGWLAGFNSNNSPDSLRGAKWDALGAKPDVPPMRMLEYDPAHPAGFTALLKSSYFAQKNELELAYDCILREKLGQGDTLDFVTVLVGAGERLGYETGSPSPLMSQLALRLDRELEKLIGGLSDKPGENGFTLAVAAAHGAPPRPPDESRARMTVDGESVAKLVDERLKTAGVGSVQKYLYPFLYLDTSAVDDPEVVRRIAADAARTHPAVADTFTAGGHCSAFNAWRRRFENSFDGRRSGDVMLSYRPGYVEKFGDGRGVSYGSLYDYETRTPLFLYGPQFKPGEYEGPVEAVDIAPTLARAVGAGMPSAATGRVLAEGLAD